MPIRHFPGRDLGKSCALFSRGSLFSRRYGRIWIICRRCGTAPQVEPHGQPGQNEDGDEEDDTAAPVATSADAGWLIGKGVHGW